MTALPGLLADALPERTHFQMMYGQQLRQAEGESADRGHHVQSVNCTA